MYSTSYSAYKKFIIHQVVDGGDHSRSHTASHDPALDAEGDPRLVMTRPCSRLRGGAPALHDGSNDWMGGSNAGGIAMNGE